MRHFMHSHLYAILVGATLMVATLPGCGSRDYQSTDDFLDSLPEDGNSGVSGMGTLPPIDRPIDQAGKIRIDVEEYDMGTIAHDQLAHGEIVVHNDGDMPLKITRIDTTCACTQGHVTPENAVVPPKGKSVIDVVVDPRRVPGFYSRKVLTITTTDISQPNIEVPVIAHVDPEYEIGSDEVDLGDIPKGEGLEHRIRFRQLIDKPIEHVKFIVVLPDAMKSLDPYIEAAVEPVPESEWRKPGRKELDLVFRVLPHMPVGEFFHYCELATDIRGGFNQYRIQFSGTVVAPYQVDPKFPAKSAIVNKNETRQLRAQATISAATPVTIGAITPRSDFIEATALPGDSANAVIIDMGYLGKLNPGKDVYEAVDVEVTVGGKTYSEMVGMHVPPMAPPQ